MFGASVAHRLAGGLGGHAGRARRRPGHERVDVGRRVAPDALRPRRPTSDTRSARRARTLWREIEAETGASLYEEAGVAWFARAEDGWEADAERVMRDEGIPTERLEPGAAAALFPSLGTDDLAYVLLEPEAGVLRARRATRALADAACKRGARFVGGLAAPDGERVRIGDQTLEADHVV